SIFRSDNFEDVPGVPKTLPFAPRHPFRATCPTLRKCPYHREPAVPANAAAHHQIHLAASSREILPSVQLDQHLIGGETGGAIVDGEPFAHHHDLYLIGKISPVAAKGE